MLSLCNLMDRSPLAPLSMGILQARIPEWVAMPSFRGFFWHRDRTWVSCVAGRFFTVWATREAQECWSELPCPSPGDLPNPGIKPGSPALQVGSLPSEPPGKPIASIHTWMQPLCMFVCGERACDEAAMEDVGKELARPDPPQFDPKLWKQPKSIPSKSREFLEKTWVVSA